MGLTSDPKPRSHPWERLPQSARIAEVTTEIKANAQDNAVAKRLQIAAGPEKDPGDRFPGDCPGIGPITASAIAASVPDESNFKAARDLSASC